MCAQDTAASRADVDAVVVGSGPNGLSAAIVLAAAGYRVVVFEAAPTIGGGTRSAPLTLPGFTHDVCSTAYTFTTSPFFRPLALEKHGLEWLSPPVMYAHPFDDGTAIAVERSLERTAEGLGADGPAYLDVIGSVVKAWPSIEGDALGPLPIPPRHPVKMARFGLRALQPATMVARRFSQARTRGMFAGVAAHGMVPLEQPATAAFGLVLGAMAHHSGWVIARGGAQRIPDAMASYLRSLGGTIVTGRRIASLDELPPSRVTLCDLSPRPFLRIAGHRLPGWYRRKLERYRYRTAAFKVDWALDGPIPWRAEACTRAGTLHLGGTLEEIAQAERDTWHGRESEKPYVLLAQPTVLDSSRAPAGRHIAWAYCHVPNGSRVDMLGRMEAQIERFAPGFGRRVIGRSVMTPEDFERGNENYAGGDIGSGASDIWQLFTRPTFLTYRTPMPGVFLCSASTPPGVGVHGMCGYHAARRALKYLQGGVQQRT
jgi:phytoene dehydrogenase-like protein